jgi:hypothetical protein
MKTARRTISTRRPQKGLRRYWLSNASRETFGSPLAAAGYNVLSTDLVDRGWRAQSNAGARKLSAAEILNVARLANLRMWDALSRREAA